MTRSADTAHDRGSALIIAMTVVVIVLGVVGSLFLVIGSSTSAVGGARDSLQAFYLAEAGLNDSYDQARKNQGFTASDVAVACVIASRSFGTEGGTYAVQATVMPDGETVSLRAVGRMRQARRTIEGQIHVDTPGPITFSHAAYAGAAVGLTGGGATDSFDSSNGMSLAAQIAGGVAANGGSVASVGAVWLNGTTSTVHGDATPGQAGPDATDGFVLTGGASLSQVMGAVGRDLQSAMPRGVLAPVAPPSIGAIVLDNSATRTLTGTVALDSISLDDSASLTIVGPARIVVAGGVSQYGSSNITYDTTNGPIEVYAAGDALLQSGTATFIPAAGRPTPRPKDVSIYMTGDTASFQSTLPTTLFATVYSAGAVQIAGTTKLAGAAVGKWVSVVGSARIYFDRDLLGRPFTPPGPRAVTFGSWRDVP